VWGRNWRYSLGITCHVWGGREHYGNSPRETEGLTAASGRTGIGGKSRGTGDHSLVDVYSGRAPGTQEKITQP